MVTVYGRGAYKKFASDLETEALREWQLGNAQLLHFYEANRRQLYEIDYEKVSASLSSIVASCFPGTKWRSFACSLGVPETELQGIEQRAVGDKLMPLQVALQHFYPSLKACSKPCSLGHLADILKERGRLDVLYKILPQVKGFLKEPPYGTRCYERRLHQKIEDVATTLSSTDSGVYTLDSGMCLSEVGLQSGALTDSTARKTAQPLPPTARNQGGIPEIFSPESNNPVVPPSFAGQKDTDLSPSTNRHDLNAESDCVSLLDRILPKAKLDKLTVLVSHVEEDIDVAYELARILETEHECYVLIQAEILPAIHTDPTLIEDLIQKVKAIVPLVSKAYLEHYEQMRRTNDLDSADSVLTREVYSLTLHRLVSNSCLYYMLFPVRTPDVEYREVRHHHIFSKSKVFCQKGLAQLVKTIHACYKLRSSGESLRES
ncbi:uncharacterized protein LOC144129320 isoform X2 [Amblyomma americanum]